MTIKLRQRKNIRYLRWISKLAFLIIFLIPVAYVSSSPYPPYYPEPYTGVTSAIARPAMPFFYVPMVQSPCSIWINGWCNLSPGMWLVEPVGAFQALVTTRVGDVTFLGTIIALAIVLALVVLVGAMFCSWVCPLGAIVDSFDSFVGRFLPKIEAKRAKIIDKNIQSMVKEQDAKKSNPTFCIACPVTKIATKNGVIATGILAGSVGAAAILGFNALCLVCPIGIATRSLFHLKSTYYVTRQVGNVTYDPKFNVLQYGGPFYLELLIFPVIAVLVSLKERRFWCNKLCPVGAAVNLTSTLNPFIKPKMNPQKCVMNGCPSDCKDSHIGYCTACRVEDNYKCLRSCPAQINLVGNGSMHRCTKCMECYIACDHGAIEIKPVGKPDAFRLGPWLKRKIKRRKTP